MVDQLPSDDLPVEAKKHPDGGVDFGRGHVLYGRKGTRKSGRLPDKPLQRVALRTAAERQGAGDVACRLRQVA